MKFSVSFLWYDFWVGGFWDRAKRVLYVCPLPCVVLKFAFKTACRDCRGTGKSHYHYAYMLGPGQTVVGSDASDLPCNFCGGTGKAFA